MITAESIPPLKDVAIGTSDSNLLSTALSNNLNVVSATSSCDSTLVGSDENWKYYEIQFLPYYIIWLSKFKGSEKNDLIKDCSILNEGNVIFNSKIGFNSINRISSRNPNIYDLKREGYQFTQNGFILEKISYGNKYIDY